MLVQIYELQQQINTQQTHTHTLQYDYDHNLGNLGKITMYTGDNLFAVIQKESIQPSKIYRGSK